ncbi:MAG: ABC transporter permease [Ignavibacteriae bacterium]|nr:ABC transporter permease [Ignavibacteriota bacterium]
MQQILYLVQKEFRQIARDRVMLGLLFVVPLIQIFILGNAVTTDVVDLRLVIHDADDTPMSRQLIESFAHTRYFKLVGREQRGGSTLTGHMDRSEAQLALSIPEGFQRDAVRGRSPALQLMVDGLDGNTAGIALAYAADISRNFQARLLEADPGLARRGAAIRGAEPEARYWYNPNLESKVYIVPGIMAIILVIITVFLTSMGIVREKEIGTLEQLLVTPIRSYQFIAGKIIPFTILGFLEIILAMVFVWLIFDISVAGSIPLLLAESALFLLTTLGLGILISTVAESQQQALFVAWFFMIFAMLLSGFFIPIANMPDAIQTITYANPVRYYLTVLREIYLKGSGPAELWKETASLAAFGVCMFGAAVWRFRRAHG